jgi:hypothetical protein
LGQQQRGQQHENRPAQPRYRIAWNCFANMVSMHTGGRLIFAECFKEKNAEH